jgi:hypothetical protein
MAEADLPDPLRVPRRRRFLAVALFCASSLVLIAAALYAAFAGTSDGPKSSPATTSLPAAPALWHRGGESGGGYDDACRSECGA